MSTRRTNVSGRIVTSARPPATRIDPVAETFRLSPKDRECAAADGPAAIEVVDPYRWLEGDNSGATELRTVTPEVAVWTDAQNAYTRVVLDSLPGRQALEDRLRPLMEVGAVSAAYSPCHHVIDVVAYPAVLLTAGEQDTRVHALHARKMAARLQSATASNPADRPVLLWVDREAGHGQGKPLNLQLRDAVDQRLFLMWQLGMLDEVQRQTSATSS